ncbi:MAG: aminopeptidase P family protein [Deltaproteobacteria bacterium]|jgi:Xaa-Pro dipeptidase|nr:aminopeptidase P family protein [Deltaproteobacteria bacterium]MBT4526206.1 aminopeptidase P family protein [Deltaproteobacteria bacterium]
MFLPQIYLDRRKLLKNQLQSGVILFLGNNESPINFADNCYPFRQDSTFLYYWGLDTPGLAAVIDIENDTEIIFGIDYTTNDTIWMGPQLSLEEQAINCGVNETQPSKNLKAFIDKATLKKREVHYLPQFRSDNILKTGQLTGLPYEVVNQRFSITLTQAIIRQRLIKADIEISQIESAMDITAQMFSLAMSTTIPGKYEFEIIGRAEGFVFSKNCNLACPFIFSVRGERLHGHLHHLKMKSGDLVVMDGGVESNLHYSSDVTRSFPVSGKFTMLQKEIYQIVLNANKTTIATLKPGILFRDAHLQAATLITRGLKELGLMAGDPEEAVSQGAHALFFPHGLGHPLGLDVHDLESMGENLVGYDQEILRSEQFGLSNLRFGKRMEENMVQTVEPGIYFIPELIRQWQSQNKFKEFINYDKVIPLIGFGGIRIEDDVLISESGCRNLSDQIPKTVTEIELALMQ